MEEIDFNEVLISEGEAEKILFDLYSIKGKAYPLPGELDFNFKINVEGKDNYILKISRPGASHEELDFQQNLLGHLEIGNKEVIAPRVIRDKAENIISEVIDKFNRPRFVRLLSWIPGRIYGKLNPQSDELRFGLGVKCGDLAAALQGFDHPLAHREFEWDIAQSLWTKSHLTLFSKEQRNIVQYFQRIFENDHPSYTLLRKSVVHNDANDNNVVVSDNIKQPEVVACIDYGDAIFTQIINDLAIACAYGIMNQNDPLAAAMPLVNGYHQSFALEEKELPHLYAAIAMRLVISVSKSAINKIKEPDNIYLQISEKPAWEVLEKWAQLSQDFVHYSFREACGFTAHPNQTAFNNWAKSREFHVQQLFPTINCQKCEHIDLSVGSKWLGHLSEFADFDFFQFKINRLRKNNPDSVIAGGYLEPRLVYSTEAYDKLGNNGSESRTIHLGVDFWLPPGTPVHAFMDGEVVLAMNDAGDKEYGGLVVLKHQTNDFHFYSLYGHLSVKSATDRKIGEQIKKGDLIALLGDYPENGNWPPHLHFELMLSMMDYSSDFPGVAYKSEVKVWKSICPDPNLLFKSDALSRDKKNSNEQLMQFREKHLGKSLSLSYDQPIQMVRGMGAYLIDQFGARYLDTVNNVAHVGHEHPNVVKAGQEQMALINTNTRYLHPNINMLANELLETFPPELCVAHFVNSGSEANELALRMVKTITGQKDIIASEVGYHGNANACIEISSYKFDGKGGSGCPEHTHIFPLPDRFRGKYRGKDCAKLYAQEVQNQIDKIQTKGRSPAAFIIEPIISCGGQIELPDGFLAQAYSSIRKAGGLCISDEVQVGCGRLGKTFWGFQLHDVIPDIVTVGKPLGNGHPIAAVVCTREVAERFANGMEYFNTFGGNPVSCAIATEVLRAVKGHKLQENALFIGEYLKEKLKALAKTYPIIADVRGQGLFLGIELTDSLRNPLPEQADYLANRMKDFGVLMSTDGPDYNVLKIKPPLVFSKDNAKELIHYLKLIFSEDFMNI